MFLIELNKYARENYAFFDPSAPIELNLANPRGYAPRLTESILRGLKGKTLIDVEGKIDIEKGVLKDGKEQRQEEEKVQEVTNEEEKKEDLSSTEVISKPEETKTKARKRK